MAFASFIPSGQVCAVGVPITALIFINMSASLDPGNNGRNMHSSAMIAPTAQLSVGELYVVDRNNTSGARYLNHGPDKPQATNKLDKYSTIASRHIL